MPWTVITSSLLSFSALAWVSLFFVGLNESWVRPYLSLRSMKISPPWSLLELFQPDRITFLFMSSFVNWLQVCVLYFMIVRGSGVYINVIVG